MTATATPAAGTAATINLYSDTQPAVVTRSTAKSVWVRTVEHIESTRHQINPGEPYPCLAWEGDLTKPCGDEQRFTLRKDGRYRCGDGSITLTLGKSVRIRDYRV